MLFPNFCSEILRKGLFLESHRNFLRVGEPGIGNFRRGGGGYLELVIHIMLQNYSKCYHAFLIQGEFRLKIKICVRLRMYACMIMSSLSWQKSCKVKFFCRTGEMLYALTSVRSLSLELFWSHLFLSSITSAT